MTTGDLIAAAARTATIIASGESLSTEEKADALVSLNMLVASWSALQIPLYELKKQTVTMTGAASYALTTRPIRIKSASVVSTSGATQPAKVATADEWAAIGDKTRTGLYAEALYCDFGFPTATAYLSPKPGAGTLELWQFEALTEFADLDTAISLPPGYERALTFALAIDLAPQYGRPVDPAVQAVANEATAAIARANAAALGETLTPAAQGA